MAIPKIWRESDGFLISDKPWAWGRWQEQTGVQENELLIGGVFHMEELGDPSQTAEVTFLFADDRPTSTLANLEILKTLRRKVRPVTFMDMRGISYSGCIIATDLAIEPRPSRLYERNLVTFTLRQGTVIP